MPVFCTNVVADTQVREPTVVSHVLETIRRGVSAVGQRAAGSPSSVSLISPENLLAGTCLRYDTSDRGALGMEELRQVRPNEYGIRTYPKSLLVVGHWEGGVSFSRTKENYSYKAYISVLRAYVL